jgi:D-alanyl-D-alanine carboxypeptidase
MKRRDFLKAATAAIIASGIDPFALSAVAQKMPRQLTPGVDDHIKDYLHKMRNFDRAHADDRYLGKDKVLLLKSTVLRLKRLQRLVGHGNFHLLSLDYGLKLSRNYSKVGKFTPKELDFLEEIFYSDSSVYGFLGVKPLDRMTASINKRDVVKIPRSGNYLYKGKPQALYAKVKKHVGDKVYLTSGVRGVVKQFMLFLNKVNNNQGNLSLASRSLAPPGYSFHGISDFDVGQKGYGAMNFTDRFTTTEVFKKLEQLDFISIRYPKENMEGVRFEPWHIRVHSS